MKSQIMSCPLEDQRQEILKEYAKDLPLQVRTHMQGLINVQPFLYVAMLRCHQRLISFLVKHICSQYCWSCNEKHDGMVNLCFCFEKIVILTKY